MGSVQLAKDLLDCAGTMAGVEFDEEWRSSSVDDPMGWLARSQTNCQGTRVGLG